MFGWFSPRCPLDVREKTWIELRMHWLVERFGKASIQRVDVITPSDEFLPDSYSGRVDEVEQLFLRVCDWIGVSHNVVELKLFDEAIPSSYLADSRVSPLGVYTQRKSPGERHIVWVQRSQVEDPLQFVATAAHELAHCILLGDEWLNDSVGDHEFITDLLPVVRGLGIFSANAATIEKVLRTSRWGAERALSKQGYLPARMFGYALAVFAWMRGEEKPTWAACICRDARGFFQNGFRYLNSTNDCRCPTLHGASSDRVPDVRWGLESNVPGEFVSALWEFRKPDRRGPSEVEWFSIVAGLGHRDLIVVTETALTIAALKKADPSVTERCLWHLRSHPDNSDLRTALALALGNQTATDPLVDELIRLLEDPSIRVIKGALAALKTLQPTDASDVIPAVLRVFRKGIVDGNDNLLLHVTEALRVLTDSPGKVVASHFAHDRELQRAAFDALRVEPDANQMTTPFVPTADSLPVPLPDWRPSPPHAGGYEEEEESDPNEQVPTR